MRILLVNQFYWPDCAATAQLLSDLGEGLADRGHEVTALCGRGSYVSGTSPRLVPLEAHRGVTIRRVWCTNLGRRSMFRRVADAVSFLVSAGARVLLGARWDVVICLSSPPFVALLGRLARLRGARFIYKVEDLYPDVAVALGALRGGSMLSRALAWLSRGALTRADAVVALDVTMASVLQRRGAQNVVVIPNWSDGLAIHPDATAGAGFRTYHGLDGRFILLYSGNLGLAHRFDAVVAAARDLAGSSPRVLLLFVGEGPRLAEVRSATNELANVRFLPYQPRETLNRLYNAADMHLVTLREEVAGLLVPSKYPAALAAGKPVLLVGGNGAEMSAEIRREEVGWVCAEDHREVAAAIREAEAEPTLVLSRGARARELFERRYDRTVATQRWAALIEDVHGR